MSWNDPCVKCGFTRSDCECTLKVEKETKVETKEISIFPTQIEIDEYIENTYSWVDEHPIELMKLTSKFIIKFIKQKIKENG